MRTASVNVYQFKELNDKAKEKAREWYRGCMDSSDFQNTVDQIKEAAQWLGFESGVDLWWSVGYCQSDHASLDGKWRASNVKAGKAAEEFPKDDALKNCAVDFESLAQRYPDAFAKTTERYVLDDVDFDPEGNLSSEDEKKLGEARDELKEAIKAFNRWAYKMLRDESDYLHSDEHVDETIEGNEYEFTEDGKRWTKEEA